MLATRVQLDGVDLNFCCRFDLRLLTYITSCRSRHQATGIRYPSSELHQRKTHAAVAASD